jgi:hypothetical protein
MPTICLHKRLRSRVVLLGPAGEEQIRRAVMTISCYECGAAFEFFGVRGEGVMLSPDRRQLSLTITEARQGTVRELLPATGWKFGSPNCERKKVPRLREMGTSNEFFSASENSRRVMACALRSTLVIIPEHTAFSPRIWPPKSRMVSLRRKNSSIQKARSAWIFIGPGFTTS